MFENTFTWGPNWTPTGLRFYFGIKFHFGVRWLHDQRSYNFERSETQFGANFTLVDLTEVKFQTTVSFPCKHQSWAESLKLLNSTRVPCYYCLKNNEDGNICFALIKFASIKTYHFHMHNRVLLLFRKMSQWNLYVNCHVHGTTFRSGLRFQTGLSSLRISCKRGLRGKKQRNLGKTSCMTKPFRHSKIYDTKRLKRIKKSEITFCKFVTGVLIFRSTHSNIFFKVGILKNFGASF